MIPAALRYKFTVDEYHRMAEAGIFSEDDRVELIEGEIVRMTPPGEPHEGTVNRLTRLFMPVGIRDRAIVSVQNSFRLSLQSVPQPDVMLLRFDSGFYGRGKAVPDDVLLLIEVSDSSLKFDRGVKLPLYAEALIREVWLVDLRALALEVYREPQAGSYRSRELLQPGDSVSPLAFPDLRIAVADILG